MQRVYMIGVTWLFVLSTSICCPSIVAAPPGVGVADFETAQKRYGYFRALDVDERDVKDVKVVFRAFDSLCKSSSWCRVYGSGKYSCRAKESPWHRTDSKGSWSRSWASIPQSIASLTKLKPGKFTDTTLDERLLVSVRDNDGIWVEHGYDRGDLPAEILDALQPLLYVARRELGPIVPTSRPKNIVKIPVGRQSAWALSNDGAIFA